MLFGVDGAQGDQEWDQEDQIDGWADVTESILENVERCQHCHPDM